MKETNVINSTGIILLTGGKSSRMHNDKMSLPWKENDTFLSALIKTSKHMGFGEILISAQSNMASSEQRVITDIFPERGPLSGIYSCLMKAKFEKNMILPVDVPQIPQELIELLVKASYEYNADITVLKFEGHYEPLLTVFDKRILPIIGKTLAEGLGRVTSIYDKVQVFEVDYRGDPMNIYNINTPEDYFRIKKYFNIH